MVYVLKNNFRFALELKSDQFAISNKKDFQHFLKGILLLEEAEEEKANIRMAYEGNSLLADDDGMIDRLKVLAMRGESRSKRILTNVVYSVIFIAIFAVSYTFIVLPIFWESPDVPVTTENFTWEDSECGDVFRPDENFIVDNGDGTFSLYIEGQFVTYMDETHEALEWLPVRDRTE